MRTIDDYIDAAIERQKLPSDRQFALHLKVNPSAISQMRTKRIWPGDETMEKIANMAGLDPDIALQELNAWRTTGSTSSRYRKIAERLAATAAIALFFIAYSAPAWAGTLAEQSNIWMSVTVYYGKLD